MKTTNNPFRSPKGLLSMAAVLLAGCALAWIPGARAQGLSIGVNIPLQTYPTYPTYQTYPAYPVYRASRAIPMAPAPLAEAIPPLAPGQSWQSGQWVWEGRQYVWHSGRVIADLSYSAPYYAEPAVYYSPRPFYAAPYYAAPYYAAPYYGSISLGISSGHRHHHHWR